MFWKRESPKRTKKVLQRIWLPQILLVEKNYTWFEGVVSCTIVLLLLGTSPAEGRDVDGGGEDRVSRLGDGVGVVGEVLDILKIPNPRIDTKYPNT